MPAPGSAPVPPSPPRRLRRGQGLALAALVIGGSLSLAWLTRQTEIGPGTGASPHPAPSPFGAASASRAPATSATLTVTTTPPGALVIVDDRIVGASPLSGVVVSPGLHAVRCELEGFLPAIAQADIRTGSSVLTLALKPVEYAQLNVVSDPAGAEILVDGEFRGRTPATLAKLLPGPHEIVIRKENFSTYQATHVLRAGQTQTVSGVVLDNKQLAMLQALCAAEPRMIGNHLDLAHFYYIHNRMDAAARHYARAIELSKLPMATLPADATEAEREQVRLNYEWDKQRVKSELDKHTRKYKQYFGNNLDFDSFLRIYRDYTGRRWDLHDADWVATEADLQLSLNRADRAVELFSDVLIREPESVAAACGLAWALLVADQPQEGLPQLETALQLSAVEPEKLRTDDRKYQARSLRWLAAASLEASRVASADDRGRLRAKALRLRQSAEALLTAQGAKADPYEAAWLVSLQAREAELKGDSPEYLRQVQAALAAAQATVKNDTEPDHRDRNAARVEQLQAAYAQALQQAGQNAAAEELWRQLLKNGNIAWPFRAQAQAALSVTTLPDTATKP